MKMHSISVHTFDLWNGADAFHCDIKENENKCEQTFQIVFIRAIWLE